MSECFDPSVAKLAAAFDRYGLLDRKSARLLPARTTTLVRRVVRHLPGELRSVLEYFAPSPTRGDATAYATALLGALETASEIDVHDVHGSLRRLEHVLESLACSSAQRGGASVEGLRGGFLAFGLRRRVFGLDGDDHVQAMRVTVALAGEGVIGKERIAYQSAFWLALIGVRIPNLSDALHLIELAHEWCPPDDEPVATYIRFNLVRIAESAGFPERTVEVAWPLVERIDEGNPALFEIAIELCQTLARAHSRLGEHDLAVERAGYAAWRSIRDKGRDHVETHEAHEALADALFGARRVGDAIDVLERDFPHRRRYLEAEPRPTLNAGCKLVIGYARLGRHNDAVALGRELVATAERYLPYSDPLLGDLRLVLARAEDDDI